MKMLMTKAVCYVRGHSPDPRTIKQAGSAYEAECYFCRADLECHPVEWTGE